MFDENPEGITTWDDGSPEDEPLDSAQLDDDCWDAFLPDEGQHDPLPEPGDFWLEDDLLEAHQQVE